MLGSTIYDSYTQSTHSCIDLHKNFDQGNPLYEYEEGKGPYMRYTSTPNQRNIIKDLDNIDIPDDIKELANNMYKEINPPTKRNISRSYMLVYFIICAYDKLNRVYDPKFLCKKMGINVKSLNKALKLDTKYKMGNFCIDRSCIDYIPMYYELMGLSGKGLLVAKDIATQIHKDDKIRRIFPQNVAKGIIYYYILIHSLNFSKSYVSEKLDMTPSSLETTKNIISVVHNSI